MPPEENKDKQYAKSLIERIREMPPPEPRNFTLADFHQMVADEEKRSIARIKYYRKMMTPSRWQRFKRFIMPWNYVHFDWVYRKPTRWQRFTTWLKSILSPK